MKAKNELIQLNKKNVKKEGKKKSTEEDMQQHEINKKDN